MITSPLIETVKRALLAMQRRSWEQGVAAQAFLELGDVDLTIALAREAAYRRTADGRLAMVDSHDQVTDPAANGEALLFAARATGDPALSTAADEQLAYLLDRAPRASDGTYFHVLHLPQMWIDTLYMAPPFLAVAGRPAEAVRQIEGLRRRLWIPDKRLYAHIWDEDLGRLARAACWGVGNGWAAAGMTRVIRALPADQTEGRDRLVGYVRDLVDACLAYQRADGLFHDVIDDPSTFVEVNLAQMLAYTIYSGVADGWLDGGLRARADRMRAVARTKVDAYGFVQDVCGAPAFDRPGVAAEGQAFFLLMEAAATHLDRGAAN